MTNADKYFRNATDEKLAEYLSELSTAPSCTGMCHKDYEVDGELLWGKLLDALANAKTIVPAEEGTKDGA